MYTEGFLIQSVVNAVIEELREKALGELTEMFHIGNDMHYFKVFMVSRILKNRTPYCYRHRK